MSEIYTQIVISVIGMISAACMTYLIAKRMVNTERILIIGEEVLSEIATNTEMQKKIYIVGGILGQGIRAGIGIGGTKGGKFKFDDIFAKIAGAAVEKFMPGLFGAEQQPEQQQSGGVFGNQ